VYHGRDRDMAESVAGRSELTNLAILFIGPAIPEGTVANLPPELRIHGLLGLDFFRSTELSIDFPARRISVL
jgi:hypothetical protein